MFDKLLEILNKPQIMWSITDKMTFFLYLLLVSLVVMFVIIGVRYLIKVIEKLKNKLIIRELDRREKERKER